jgi:hypothetical protein
VSKPDIYARSTSAAVERFHFRGIAGGKFERVINTWGYWVRYSDYARLQEQLEAVTRERDDARANHEYSAIQWDEQRIRAEAAEAEVKRLKLELTSLKFERDKWKRTAYMYFTEKGGVSE